MGIVTKQVREGAHYAYRIFAVGKRTAEGKLDCPVLDFFRESSKVRPELTERLSALLDYTALRGPPRNPQKFKHLAGSEGIFEFKVFQLRLLCFWDTERLIICTNGTVKKDNKSDRDVIKVAEEWRRTYFNAKNRGYLHHEREHV